MSVGIDPEGLFAIYADWIAFLREKRMMFEGQLAKVQGKEVPGKNLSKKALPEKENEAPSEAQVDEIPEWLGQTAASMGEDEKTSTLLWENEEEEDEWT
ncbi:MAG: hypothetical protein HUU38_24905 [Anaerolineales bacterium]|nr:hypothetical protein [Anaerolineales bacterium]